tara:strand:- start:1309 stop:1578 length:270 start_codon:yes stop_codon:yes gene_type:complete
MKTVRGKQMVTLEERLRADMLFYEALSIDEERFPSFDTRYDLGAIFKSLRCVVEKFNFVDDIRNELNIPTTEETDGRQIHYGSDDVTSN